jgi:ADP-heptose:LPS heptosyltransferase
VSAPRVVLLRPDHLGDLLLSLPGVMTLRELVPGSTLAVAAPPGVVAVAARCPAVDATLPVPFPPPTAPDRPPGWEARADEEAASLRGQFDIALLPRLDDPWSGLVAARADLPRRIGFDHPRTRPYLTEALPVPALSHVVELTAAVAWQAAGRGGLPPTPPAGPWLVPTAADHVEAAGALAGMDAPFVALHPGSGWPLKAWLPECWGALARALHYHSAPRPLEVVVTGSAGETDLVAAVVAASGGVARGLAGQVSLGGLAALYRRATLLIALDSGPLHLATAVGTPVVGLYGPADPQEFGPWSQAGRSAVVVAELPCRPCRSLDQPPCGAVVQPACLRLLGVESVLAAAAGVLQGALSHPR